MSNDIDISDLNRAAVLATLFNASHAQGLGFLEASESSMTVEEAQAILDTDQTYFDYLQGRVMKVELKGDTFNPWLYDRDNGEGAAFTAIKALRETAIVDGDDIQRLHEHGTANAATELQGRYGDKAIEMAKKASRPYAR